MQNYNKVKKDNIIICYYLNDKLHRADGSAIEWANGCKEWWQNNLLHRIDGPALENINGYKLWFYEGKNIKCNSQEEFERLIKLKLFW